MDIKYIGGADPEMVLLSKDNEEVQVHHLIACHCGKK